MLVGGKCGGAGRRIFESENHLGIAEQVRLGKCERGQGAFKVGGIAFAIGPIPVPVPKQSRFAMLN
jgi:hypothetical protein